MARLCQVNSLLSCEKIEKLKVVQLFYILSNIEDSSLATSHNTIVLILNIVVQALVKYLIGLIYFSLLTNDFMHSYSAMYLFKLTTPFFWVISLLYFKNSLCSLDTSILSDT